jgi:galactose-1-phosphate uridylyltransferase
MQGKAWVSKLPLDKRPVEDCVRLGRLLSGDTITPLGELNPSESESLASLWKRLRAAYPPQFTTSPEEITAWHEFMAEVSEQEHDGFAAAFHVERLLLTRPGDLLLMDRLMHLKDTRTARKIR